MKVKHKGTEFEAATWPGHSQPVSISDDLPLVRAYQEGTTAAYRVCPRCSLREHTHGYTQHGGKSVKVCQGDVLVLANGKLESWRPSKFAEIYDEVL